MSQPCGGGRPRGNPVQRRRGDAVRAVLLATVKRGDAVPLDEVLYVTGITRQTLIGHLGALVEKGRLRRYTTAKGMVRVW